MLISFVFIFLETTLLVKLHHLTGSFDTFNRTQTTWAGKVVRKLVSCIVRPAHGTFQVDKPPLLSTALVKTQGKVGLVNHSPSSTSRSVAHPPTRSGHCSPWGELKNCNYTNAISLREPSTSLFKPKSSLVEMGYARRSLEVYGTPWWWSRTRTNTPIRRQGY